MTPPTHGPQDLGRETASDILASVLLAAPGPCTLAAVNAAQTAFYTVEASVIAALLLPIALTLPRSLASLFDGAALVLVAMLSFFLLMFSASGLVDALMFLALEAFPDLDPASLDRYRTGQWWDMLAPLAATLALLFLSMSTFFFSELRRRLGDCSS